jgi:hypothetical protein
LLHDRFPAVLWGPRRDLLREQFVREGTNLLWEQRVLWTKAGLQERTLSSIESLIEL